MILNVHGYRWIEKDSRACLIRNEDELLWWGDPDEIPAMPTVPVAILLELSIARKIHLDQVEEPSYTS